MGETLERNLDHPSTPLEREIADLGPWFHNIHLPCGAQTAPGHPLGDFPRFKWEQIEPHLPQDLAGWDALDVGCNAGFYCFKLAERGARVTGIDINLRYLRQAAWAASRLGVAGRVRFEPMQIHELSRHHREFDLTWFMGVFYHLRYPTLALDILRRRTRRLMVFQTLTMPGDQIDATPKDLDIASRAALTSQGWPRLAFIEHSLAGDPTNWWAPNPACVEALLRFSGFQVVSRPADEIYVCEPVEIADRDLRQIMDAEYQAATGCGPVAPIDF